MVHTLQIPTPDEIRDEALKNVPLEEFNVKGRKGDGIALIAEEFCKLQFKYFPAFCEHTRIVNMRHLKELNQYGNRSKLFYAGNMRCGDTTGWSKDKHFKHQWIIPKQLKQFMEHIYKDFWADSNAKIRDRFMKKLLKGDNLGDGKDYYSLLEEVYAEYGQNLIKVVTKEDLQEIGLS